MRPRLSLAVAEPILTLCGSRRIKNDHLDPKRAHVHTIPYSYLLHDINAGSIEHRHRRFAPDGDGVLDRLFDHHGWRRRPYNSLFDFGINIHPSFLVFQY